MSPVDVLDWMRAVSRADLPASTKSCLWALALRLNTRQGVAFPSHQTVAEDTGLSVRTVGDHLRGAVEAGWLEERRRGPRSSEYAPLMPVVRVNDRQQLPIRSAVVAEHDRQQLPTEREDLVKGLSKDPTAGSASPPGSDSWSGAAVTTGSSTSTATTDTGDGFSVPFLREIAWLAEEPPGYGSARGRAIGRERNIWRSLLDAEELLPDELEHVVQEVRRRAGDEPFSLKRLNGATYRGRLREIVHAYRKVQLARTRTGDTATNGAGVQTLGEILAGAVP